ncbi:MAG TPA: ATP-binding cassette domain-containing protein [Chitinophagaceae bacterium]|nr:ATP-binding cassette domain-containing protein [Chitinophagaceae bacterium]
MLELEHIEKHFNKRTPAEVRAVGGLDLTVKDGEFLVLIGFNGSGKTTLLNLISGTLAPDSGSIRIDGKEVTGLKDYQRSFWIARIFQNPLAGTAPDLSILDNFRLASLRTRPKSFRTAVDRRFRQRVKERLSLLHMGLEDKTDSLVGKLSGGQRQALTLLMAVMDRSRILLMDEPTAALDPKSSDLLIHMAAALIRELGLTAILVTHDLRYAGTYGTRLIMMQEGKIKQDLDQSEKASLTPAGLVQWFT